MFKEKLKRDWTRAKESGHPNLPEKPYPYQVQETTATLRGWSLCEIMDQAGAGFYKPGQQQRLSLLEGKQDKMTIKEICSPEGLNFNPARLNLDWSALLLHSNPKERSCLN